jgi:glutaredoxin
MRARVWFCCLLSVLAACRSPAGPAAEAQQTPGEAAATPALPPLRLADDTPNLLLTWVGDDGDFHVVESIVAVPPEKRQQVRVVVTDQPAGNGQAVYVADLNAKRDDGSYAVTTLSRADWEKIGADKRKTRLEALAPQRLTPGAPNAGGGPGAGPTGTAPPSDGSAGPGGSAPQPAGERLPTSSAVTAIIYGASWCKPCHDAERYLKSLGVSVTKKDVEESRAAQAEMREKLVRVNRMGAGIPVIDIMGTIFVGYSPVPLKQAVDAARHAIAQRAG